MRGPTVLYVLQLALLSTHQVDAAYWHEWDVFGLPVGLPFFLAFNLFAMIALGLGLVVVVREGRYARVGAFGCAGTGLVTCVIHAVFLFRDPVAFWAPASLLVLGAILATSLAQFVLSRPTR